MRTVMLVVIAALGGCGEPGPTSHPDASTRPDATMAIDAGVDAIPARGGWSTIDVGGPLDRVTSIWGADGDLYATTPVYRASAGVWAPRPGAFGLALWGSGPDDVYLLAEGMLWRSRDGGAWQQETLPTPPGTAWRGIWGASATDVYIVGDFVGDGPRIAHSTGDGTWQLETLPPLEQEITQLFSVWGSGPDDIYAVGAVGVVLHSTGNGTWERQPRATTSYLLAVWGSSATDVYAVGLSGSIVHSTGTGAWTAIDAGVLSDLEAVWGSSSTDVYVVGRFGTILHGGEDGLVRLDDAPESDLHAVWGASAAEVYVGGTGFIARRAQE